MLYFQSNSARDNVIVCYINYDKLYKYICYSQDGQHKKVEKIGIKFPSFFYYMGKMDNKEERVKVFYKDDLGHLRNKILIIKLRTGKIIKFFNEQTGKSEWINEKYISRMEEYDGNRQFQKNI